MDAQIIQLSYLLIQTITFSLVARYSTKHFSLLRAFLIALLLGFVCSVIVWGIFWENQTLAWEGLSYVFWITLYMVFEVQILYGKSKQRYDHEDYLLATIMAYVDFYTYFVDVFLVFGRA